MRWLVAVCLPLTLLSTTSSASVFTEPDPTLLEGPLLRVDRTGKTDRVAPQNVAFVVRTRSASQSIQLARSANESLDSEPVDDVRRGILLRFAAKAQVALYTPEAPLPTGTTFVSLLSDGREFQAQGHVEGRPNAPTIERAELSETPDDTVARVAFEPAPARDTSTGPMLYGLYFGATVDEVEDAVDPHTIGMLEPSVVPTEGARFVAVTAFDQAGNESAKVILPLERSSGCRATSSHPGPWSWLAFGALVLRLYQRRQARG